MFGLPCIVSSYVPTVFDTVIVPVVTPLFSTAILNGVPCAAAVIVTTPAAGTVVFTLKLITGSAVIEAVKESSTSVSSLVFVTV